MKPEHEAILLANTIVAQDLAERGELVVSNHLVRMENSIRELSAEVAEAKKDYGCLAKKAREYEDDRDRNAELWEAMKAERDALAGALRGLLDTSAVITPADYDPCFVHLECLTPEYEAAYDALAQAGQTGGTAG